MTGREALETVFKDCVVRLRAYGVIRQSIHGRILAPWYGLTAVDEVRTRLPDRILEGASDCKRSRNRECQA